MLSKPLVVRRITYRLIVSYSEARAAKDLIVRTKGLARLKKTMAAGRLTKEHINNRGYNKYLKMEGHTRIHIDEESFKADGCWDGLKGYLTNTTLDAQAVMAAYGQLWEIERTFRISKTDLCIRPVYHYKARRIMAHMCIAFVACKLFKELERQLRQKGSSLSAEKAIIIMKTIFGMTVTLPQSKKKKLMLLDKTADQKTLLKLFN